MLFHKWVQFRRFITAAAAAAGIVVYSKPDVEHLNEYHGGFGAHDQNQQYSISHLKSPLTYRIYLINRPGRLLTFWTLRVGAYSRLGAYNIFTLFNKCSVYILQQNSKW